jgi:nucleotide-binding universal stress UspA family protein
MFAHLLVPVDGSEHAGRAVDVACALAKSEGAKLTLLHVMSQTGRDRVPPELETFSEIEQVKVTERDLIERVGREILTRAQRRAADNGIAQCNALMEHGDPAACIVEHASKDGVDLIVMGRRGLGDLRGLMLGSVSHKVGHATDCSCLTVK